MELRQRGGGSEPFRLSVPRWGDTRSPGQLAGFGDVEELLMASLLSEGFEGAGYENSWSETLGGGNTVDEDSAAVARPVSGGDQILETSLGGTNTLSYTEHDLGSDQTIIYMTAFLYVDSSSGTSDATIERIFLVDGVVANILVELRNTGPRGWYLRYRRYSSGEATIGNLDGDSNDDMQLTTDTWYRVGLAYDSDADTAEGRLWAADGTTLIASDSQAGLNGRVDSQIIKVGQQGAKTGAETIYWDHIEVDDADWPAAPSAPSAGNPWYQYMQEKLAAGM